MNRRDFVKRLTMVSAVVAGSGFAGYGCAKPAPNVRWSMGWILWRDFKRADIPLGEAINNLYELGLDGIEYTPRPDELSKHGFTRESFRDLIAGKKLAIAGNYFGGNFHDPAKQGEILTAFRKTLENLKFYGAKDVIIGPPGRGNWTDHHHQTGSGMESDIPNQIRAMAPFLNKLGQIAADEGLQIGLHPHVNTIVEQPDEIDLIMALTDAKYVKMVPDTGHIFLGGGNVAEIIRKYSDRISYFHLKDAAGKFERPNFGPNIRELGQGEIDFPEVMRILKDIRYEGWLNVEQDYTTLTPSESAKESMNYINQSMKPVYT